MHKCRKHNNITYDCGEEQHECVCSVSSGSFFTMSTVPFVSGKYNTYSRLYNKHANIKNIMYIILYEHRFMQNVAVIIVFVVVHTYIHKV